MCLALSGTDLPDEHRHQHLLALEGPELAQRSVSIRFYVTLPYVCGSQENWTDAFVVPRRANTQFQ